MSSKFIGDVTIISVTIYVNRLTNIFHELSIPRLPKVWQILVSKMHTEFIRQLVFIVNVSVMSAVFIIMSIISLALDQLLLVQSRNQMVH